MLKNTNNRGSRFLDRLSLWNRRLNVYLAVIGGAALVGIMIVAALNVALRLFGMSFLGAYEMVRYLGAVAVAMALGISQIHNDHIMVDVFSRKFHPVVIRILDALHFVITTIFFSVAARQVYLWGMIKLRNKEVSETLKIPFYPVIFLLAFGLAILALALFVDFLLLFCRREAGEAAS